MKTIDKAIEMCDKFKGDMFHIKCNDPDGELKGLLECIKDYTYSGHSFPVVVDPDNKDYEKKFYLDGDGFCYIQEVKFEKGVE